MRSRLDYSLVWQGTGQIGSAHSDLDARLIGSRHCAPVALASTAGCEKSSWQLGSNVIGADVNDDEAPEVVVLFATGAGFWMWLRAKQKSRDDDDDDEYDAVMGMRTKIRHEAGI